MVTVVVPVYNTEKYLERCVESLVRQTYRDLEIILVNDGSTDNSGQICDQYKTVDPRIKVIHKQNGGLSSARNAGLEIAAGSYIGFVDSDDYVDTNMFELIVKNAVQSNADISGIDYQIFHHEPKEPKIGAKNYVSCGSHKIKKWVLQKNRLYCCVRYLFRKSIIQDLRFKPEIKLGEDQDFIYRAFSRAAKIVYNRYNGYFYYANEASLSGGTVKNSSYDIAVRKEIFAIQDERDLKRLARLHLLKGYLGFYVRAEKHGHCENFDLIKNYGDEIRKNAGFLFFSGIDFRRKIAFLSICISDKFAGKALKRFG